MFTFATTAASAVGVLAACGESNLGIPFYGASCTDPEQCNYSQDSGTGFNDEAGYGSQPDANLLDASPDDATIIDDGGDAADANEDAD